MTLSATMTLTTPPLLLHHANSPSTCHVIIRQGEVVFRGHERLPLTYLITRKPIGSTATLTLLRTKGAKPGAAVKATPVKSPRAASGGGGWFGSGGGGGGGGGGAGARPTSAVCRKVADVVEREEVTVEITLAARHNWLPRLLGFDFGKEGQAEYLMCAGFVFIVPSMPLEEWIYSKYSSLGSPGKLLQTLGKLRSRAYKRKDRQAVILAGILPHAINNK